MKIRVGGDISQPTRIVEGASTVVLYDNFDQPILVAQSVDKGTIAIYRRDKDAKFREVIANLGIGLNTEVETTKL